MGARSDLPVLRDPSPPLDRKSPYFESKSTAKKVFSGAVEVARCQVGRTARAIVAQHPKEQSKFFP